MREAWYNATSSYLMVLDVPFIPKCSMSAFSEFLADFNDTLRIELPFDDRERTIPPYLLICSQQALAR